MMTRAALAAGLELASARLRTASVEVQRGDVGKAKEEIREATEKLEIVVRELGSHAA